MVLYNKKKISINEKLFCNLNKLKNNDEALQTFAEVKVSYKSSNYPLNKQKS